MIEGRVLPTNGRHLLLYVAPGRLVGAGTPQIVCQPCDIGISERPVVAGHHQTRPALSDADAVQQHLNKVGWFAQPRRAVEGEFGTCSNWGRPRIEMAADARARIQLRVRVIVLATAEKGRRQRLLDGWLNGGLTSGRVVEIGEI